jgi:tetratricopeptide (TPR) repeat protein
LSRHPTTTELEAFLHGRLPGERMRCVVRHLLQGCTACKAQLKKRRTLLAASDRRLSAVEDAAYSAVLDRSMKKARQINREANKARKIEPLLAQGGLKAVVQAADLPLRGLGMYTALLSRSWAIRHEDPREMVRLARVAVEVAGRLEAKLYGAQVLIDLQARAWGELANAFRVADDLAEAEHAFGTAFELFQKGTGDPYLKVRLYDLQASFLGTRREFALAFASLDVAYKTYIELGDVHLAGRSLLIKAIYQYYSGSPEEALKTSKLGLPLIDSTLDADLLFHAVHNEVTFLVACGRFREARRALFDHQPKLGRRIGKVNSLKLSALARKFGHVFVRLPVGGLGRSLFEVVWPDPGE